MEVKFLETTVTIDTITESLLFSWMLIHKDVKAFRIKDVYAVIEWEDNRVFGGAYVKVTDSNHQYTHHIPDPFEYCTSMNKKIDSYLLDYRNEGDYAYINKHDELCIGKGNYNVKFKVNEELGIDNAEFWSNRINPEVKTLGVGGSKVEYEMRFSGYDDIIIDYDVENPLNSTFTFKNEE